MIYKGAVPQVVEVGPFVYREYDNWTEPTTWDESLSVPGQPFNRSAIRMTFNTRARLDEDETDPEDLEDLDDEIWQIN